jgi:diaminopimelate epimerase
MTTPVAVVKAHAYGNDFLLVPEASFLHTDAAQSTSDAARTTARPRHSSPEASNGGTVRDLAKAICHRHHGIGADGLILYTLRDRGAAMKLWNADGSPSELSGNGLRCLAALIARARRTAVGSSIAVDTDAGLKTLELLAHDGERYTFRAAMGLPEDLRQISIPVGGESVTASVLRLGNPQCIVIGPLPDSERFNRLGRALATHPMFPAGTNVEFAQIEASDRVKILIWERGVGPTTSSGTGTSASAVAAAAHGGAAKALDVVAPGGTQRVEWRDDGVYLTGWAELVFEGEYIGPF